MAQPPSAEHYRALIGWYRNRGIAQVIGNKELNRLAPAIAKPTLEKTTTSSSPTQPAVRLAAQALDKSRFQSAFANRLSEAESSAKDATSLEELVAAINRFDGCSEIRKSARQTVIYEGSPDSGLLLVGEAPGADEDQQGKPFVGRSGQLLTQFLAAIGLTSREQYLITNSVFWRPPGNRTPTEREVALCLPFVHRLIDLCQPKILVTVGSLAMRSLLPVSAGIVSQHGSWHTYTSPSGFQVDSFILYHPAYLLRRPSERRAMWQDCLQLKDRLRQLSHSDVI